MHAAQWGTLYRLVHTLTATNVAEGWAIEAEDPHELALFERAAELYQALGDVPGEAESLFWVGCFRQVVRRDNDAAVPVLDRSCELGAQAGDMLPRSWAT